MNSKKEKTGKSTVKPSGLAVGAVVGIGRNHRPENRQQRDEKDDCGDLQKPEGRADICQHVPQNGKQRERSLSIAGGAEGEQQKREGEKQI